MRSISLATAIALLTTLTLFTACSKEESAPAPEAKYKPPAIQAAEKAAGLADMNTGRSVYEQNCSYCHTTGNLDAPKIGDKKAWASHMHQSLEHMVKNAIFGIGKMPPQGGNHKLTDAEVKMAVEYIIQESK